MAAECLGCAEGLPENECPKSEVPCGHHDNASWETDECAWCGTEFGDDARYCACGEMITNGSDTCLGCYLKEA